MATRTQYGVRWTHRGDAFDEWYASEAIADRILERRLRDGLACEKVTREVPVPNTRGSEDTDIPIQASRDLAVLAQARMALQGASNRRWLVEAHRRERWSTWIDVTDEVRAGYADVFDALLAWEDR